MRRPRRWGRRAVKGRRGLAGGADEPRAEGLTGVEGGKGIHEEEGDELAVCGARRPRGRRGRTKRRNAKKEGPWPPAEARCNGWSKGRRCGGDGRTSSASKVAIPTNSEGCGSVLRKVGCACVQYPLGIEVDFQFRILRHPNTWYSGQ